MSATRMSYECAGWKANTDAINDHATRIDEMAARLASQAKRIKALEDRAATPQPMSEDPHKFVIYTGKPDPKSWGDRMLAAVRKEKHRIFLSTTRDGDAPAWCKESWSAFAPEAECAALVAEAEAAMKPGWRPMATAPRDGRWVVLRFGSSRNFIVAAAEGGRRWRAKDGSLWDSIDFSGWLPIPGEGDA